MSKITTVEADKILMKLIRENEELDGIEKALSIKALLPINEVQIEVILTQYPTNNDMSELREVFEDKIAKCKLIALLDDSIPRSFYVNEDNRRYRYLSILADIFNEAKIQIMERNGPPENKGSEESQVDTNAILISFMDAEIEKSSMSSEDKELMKTRVRDHVGCGPEMTRIVLEACPYTLDNLDYLYNTTAGCDNEIAQMYMSDHPEDSKEFVTEFLRVFNTGLKELLRWHLTNKEQKKNK